MHDEKEHDLEALTRLVARADQVLIVRGRQYDPRHRKNNDVMGRARSRPAIDALIGALALKPCDKKYSMMTLGDPTLVFLEGKTIIASVSLILPYIRCHALWTYDVPLRAPRALEAWVRHYTPPAPED